MITLEHATVHAPSSSGSISILHDISLTVTRGQWLAVVGANGAGKSTLLSVLASLRPLDGGVMRYHDGGGRPRVGLLLQDPDNQMVTSSVHHELALSVPAGCDRDEVGRLVADASARFGLEGMGRRNPHRLSGGEKQRLALASVWLQRPDLVLLDEPTAFLDPPSTRRCVEFAREMRAGGAAVVWVGPGEDDAEHADAIVCLERGGVAFYGSVAEWRGWDGRAAYRFPDAPAAAAAETGDVALEFAAVGFAYDDNEVFTDLSLAVRTGECVGIAGGNGAGKSTLLHLAGGVLKPARGRVTRSLGDTPGRQPVFFLPQSPERMFFAETVEEELTFGLRRLGVGRDEARRRASSALEGVGLDPERVLGRQPFDLSYGEMRRVAFAVAAVLEPSLLLLDEPTACLDPDGVVLFYTLLEARRRARSAVVVASHNLRALSACDRVVTPGGP